MYFDGFVSGVLGCVCTGAFLLPPWCNLSSESSLYCNISLFESGSFPYIGCKDECIPYEEKTCMCLLTTGWSTHR